MSVSEAKSQQSDVGQMHLKNRTCHNSYVWQADKSHNLVLTKIADIVFFYYENLAFELSPTVAGL